MLESLFRIPDQNVTYLLALGLAIGLLIEVSRRLRELKAIVAGMVYLTTGLWYFADPLIRPDAYVGMDGADFDNAYLQVIVFLMAFRIGFQFLPNRVPTSVLKAFDPRELETGRVLSTLLLVWGVLFVIGMFRAEFRFVDTLFPLDGRWRGARMWGRGRFGGAIGFLISTGSACYLASCAMLGVVAVATRRPGVRLLMLGLVCLTWPMFLLSGTRSAFLAVAVPSVLSFLIWSRRSLWQRMLFVGGCFALVNVAMLVSITYRNSGIGSFFEEESYSDALAGSRHVGLNMPEELMLINRYQEAEMLEVEWGAEYFAQAVNWVPRAVWPDKPMPGQRYAILRVGYNSEGKAAATISNGLVGQGVQNFGTWLGPVAPAIIMLIMISWICRLPKRGSPFLRAVLVIFLIALIPNLGRDLTLLTLWPVIFAAAGVFLFERSTGRSKLVNHLASPTRNTAVRSARPVQRRPPRMVQIDRSGK